MNAFVLTLTSLGLVTRQSGKPFAGIQVFNRFWVPPIEQYRVCLPHLPCTGCAE